MNTDNDSSGGSYTLSRDVRAKRAVLWVRDTKKKADQFRCLAFGLKDLLVAVGGSRELSELQSEYIKSLPREHPRRSGAIGKELGRADIRRMFAPNYEYENAHNMHLTDFTPHRTGGGRVSLTEIGKAIAATRRKAEG